MTRLSEAKKAELRAAAEKATPGYWLPNGGFVRDRVDLRIANCLADWKSGERAVDDAAHIANCDPQTILSLLDEVEALRDAHQSIVQWSEAYPLDVFPEPDLKQARALLEAGGMTLDAISADAMRHVIEGVGKISRRALSDQTEAPE